MGSQNDANKLNSMQDTIELTIKLQVKLKWDLILVKSNQTKNILYLL